MLTKLFSNVVAKARNGKNGKKQLGVTAIEYAIIGVAISAIVLAMFNSDALKGTLTGAVSTITSNIDAAKDL